MRLYPSEKQKILLEKHFGSCRFVWNHFLEVRNKYYAEHKNEKKKGLTAFDTMKMLTVLKKEVTWLNESNSQSLQHSLVKLDKGFIKVGKGPPELTPVEIATAAELSKGGLRVATL